MTQEERRKWLILELREDDPRLNLYNILDDEVSQEKLLQGYMTMWMPKPLTWKVIKIQNEYLQEENRMIGIQELSDLEPEESDPRIYVYRGDITLLRADAIVRRSNRGLLSTFDPMDRSMDRKLFLRAGLELRYDLNEIVKGHRHYEPTGQARITSGYNLPCRNIIHTVMPISQRRPSNEAIKEMTSCYSACLDLAEENGLQSIAFLSVSSEPRHFPFTREAKIAVQTVRKWLDKTGSSMKVIFTVTKKREQNYYRKLLNEAE